MARIDKEALEALESYFGGEGVTLKEFVSIMGETLRTSDEQEAVGALCGLFKEIDINGDGRLEWQEFIQFIMDHVNARHAKSSKWDGID